MSLQEKFWLEIKMANNPVAAGIKKLQVLVMVIVTGKY